MLKRIKLRTPVLFGFVMAAITLILLLVSGILGGMIAQVSAYLCGNEEPSYYLSVLLQEVFAAVALLLIVRKAGCMPGMFRAGCGWLHSIGVALYPLCFALYIGISMLASAHMTGPNEMQPLLEIIFFFGAMFFIGFVEEFIYRGTIARVLLQHYGTSNAGIWKTIIVSGLIFGSSHLLNIISVDPLGVLVQTIVAVVIGALFAAIYFRTGNLWIVIIAHAAVNTASLIQGGLYKMGDGSTIDGVISSFTWLNLMPVLVYGIPTLFILRKSRQFEIRYWFGDEVAEPQEVDADADTQGDT